MWRSDGLRSGLLAGVALLGGLLLAGWTMLPAAMPPMQIGRSQPPGRLLYVRDGNIWLWQNGSTHQLTSGETWRQPVWSPDGTQIAYVYRGQNFSDIFVMAADGTDNRRLTRNQSRVLDDNDWVFRPSWSPDGVQISFITDSGSSFLQPWTMGKDGSGRRGLPFAGVFEMVDSVVWGPDGKRLAIAGFRRAPAPSQINMWEQGKPPQQITESPGGAFDPAWAPNGGWISYAARNDGRSRIYARALETGEEFQVSKLDLARSPVWSPDGRWIAFLSAQKGNFDVIAVEVEIKDDKLVVGNERTLVVDASADGVSGLSWAH